MNNAEAQFILAAYRPDGQDAGDPHFADALKQAQADPQLQTWLAASLDWDARVSAALRAAAVPPHLRDSILLGHKVVPMSRFRLRVPWIAAAAAVVLLGLVGSLFTVHHLNTPSFTTLQQELPQVMTRVKGLDLVTSDLDKIKSHLVSRKAPADLHVPEKLRDLPCLGCGVVAWHERKVALICFRLDEPEGQVAHLLVMDVRDLRDLPGLLPSSVEQPPWSIAGWRDERNAYLLATASGGKSAQSLLGAGP